MRSTKVKDREEEEEEDYCAEKEEERETLALFLERESKRIERMMMMIYDATLRTMMKIPTITR